MLRKAQLSREPCWNPGQSRADDEIRAMDTCQHCGPQPSTATPGTPTQEVAAELFLPVFSLVKRPCVGGEVGNVCQLCHQGAKSRAGKGGAARSQEEGRGSGLHPRGHPARATELKATGRGGGGEWAAGM